MVISIESACVSVSTGYRLSSFLTVKLKVPVAVGVPLMMPVALASESPVGSAPSLIDQ